MGKMDQNMNFRCEEEFALWVAKASCRLDMSRSEFIREALIRGYKVLKEELQTRDAEKDTKYPL